MKFKILIVLCLIIGGVVGYKFYNEKVEEESVKTYETEKIFRMDLTASIEVSSRLTARVKEIPVKKNDRVITVKLYEI